jgi:hypothetical protein
MIGPPAEPAGDGRDDRGRFGPGNTAGRGNPLARRVQRLRVALLEAVSEEDVAAVARALVEKAKGGDVAAARVLLERVLGPAEAADIEGRLAELEADLAASRWKG